MSSMYLLTLSTQKHQHLLSRPCISTQQMQDASAGRSGLPRHRTSQLRADRSVEHFMLYVRDYQLICDMSTWAYERLNVEGSEVRLLHVQPGNGSERLQCSLEVVSLQNDPKYETISYCWGEATRDGTLLVNGSHLSVRQNAVAALRQVRSSNDRRTVWIDAVCINQEDPSERSQQVAIMGVIYRKATGNLIHLDSMTVSATNAFQLAEHLTTLERKIDEAAAVLLENSVEWQIFSEGSRFPSGCFTTDLVSREDVAIAESLYASAWFSRLWVVQEAAFAKSNTCFFNGAEIPLLRILKVGQAYIDTAAPGPLLNQDVERGLDNAATMRRFIVGARKLEFDDIYMLCHRLNVTEQRDMIFAVVNLYCRAAGLPAIPPMLRPDYQKTTIEVFQDATRYVLIEEGDWILNHIHHRSVEDVNMAGKPSWMYIWGQDVNPRKDPEPFHVSNLRTSHHADGAARSGHLMIAPSTSPHVLRLKAFICGKIDFVTRLITTAMLNNVEGVKTIVHIATALVEGVLGEARNNIADALVRHVLASLLTAGDDERSEALVQRKARGLESFVATLQNLATLPEDPASLSGEFYIAMKHGLEHRAMFSAIMQLQGNDVKLLGLGSKLARKGDILAVFEGGRFLVVVRPIGGQNHFIGTAYVPSLMENEIYSCPREAEWIEIV